MSARIDERTQFVDTAGKPLVNGKIYIGEVGLDPVINPITIYSDRELTTVLANPQLLDSYGRSANKIWIPGKYSMRVVDEFDVQALEDLDAGALAEVGNTRLTDVLGTDTITANAVNTITSYVDGQTYVFTIANTNTDAVTLNIDGLGAKFIRKNYTDDLDISDLTATFEAVVVYNLQNDIFQLITIQATNINPNLFINGAFEIWQRGTTFNGDGYTADRFRSDIRPSDGGVGVVTRQAFTAGQTDVPNHSTYFLQHVQSTGTAALQPNLLQRIEGVQKHSDGDFIFTGWARVTAGTINVFPAILQSFGSGGSPNVSISGTTTTLTTTWQKFTWTFAVPSVASKTIGVGNYLRFGLFFPAAATYTIQTSNWKAEAGDVSTEFSLAGGSIGGEIELAQRYYEKSYDIAVVPGTLNDVGVLSGNIAKDASNGNWFTVQYATRKRATPTVVIYNPSALDDSGNYYNEDDAAAYAATIEATGEMNFRMRPTGATGVNLGDRIKFHYTIEAEL